MSRVEKMYANLRLPTNEKRTDRETRRAEVWSATLEGNAGFVAYSRGWGRLGHERGAASPVAWWLELRLCLPTRSAICSGRELRGCPAPPASEDGRDQRTGGGRVFCTLLPGCSGRYQGSALSSSAYNGRFFALPGARSAPAPLEAWTWLYDLAEENGERVRLDWKDGGPESKFKDSRSALAAVIPRLSWRVDMAFRFRRSQQINLLELASLTARIKKLARSGVRRSRVLVAVDSRVVLGAVATGRSSSPLWALP